MNTAHAANHLERTLRQPRLLWALVLGFALLNIVAFVGRGLGDQRPRIDYHVYLGAASRADRGISPYEGGWEEGMPYLYPQFCAWLLIPLSRLERPTADTVWFLLNGAIYCAIPLVMLWWTRRQDWGAAAAPPPGRSTPVRWAILAAAGVAALGFTPVHFGWRLGQIDLLITGIMAAAFLVPRRFTPEAVGVAVALGVLIKLAPVLLVPALALALGWRFVGAFAAVIGAYVVALVASGLFNNELFLFTDSLTFKKYNTVYPASSIYSLFCVQLFPGTFVRPDGGYGGWLTSLLTVAVLGGYAAVGLWLWWRRAGWFQLLAVAVAFGHLASPYMEPHHATNTLLVLIPWLAVFALRGDSVPLALAGGCWLLGHVFLPWNEAVSAPWAQHALLLIDVAVIAIALMRPQLFGSSPWLLERGRFPEPTTRSGSS